MMIWSFLFGLKNSIPLMTDTIFIISIYHNMTDMTIWLTDKMNDVVWKWSSYLNFPVSYL